MEIAWIGATEELEAWLEGPFGGALGVDTEADSFHHYREKVCLLQLSSGDRHALVDPLGPVDLSPLAGPFSDRSLPKILHGSDYDVRLMARDFGLRISGLVDTMIAARLLGEPALGLAALLEKYLGVALDKSHQRADWSKRPLSDGMRRYAVEDTRHLERLAALLAGRLAAAGRSDWAREECERLEAVTWRDRRDDDPEPFRRTKGARELDPAGLAVLRELWRWRDRIARDRDVPHFRVLHDETLVALAKTPPASVGDLSRVPGFPGAWIRSPLAPDIVEAARAGAACADRDRPRVVVVERRRLTAEVAARVARLRDARDRLARDLALDPTVLASRSVVEEIATRFEAGEDPWSAPELRRWQAQLLRAALR